MGWPGARGTYGDAAAARGAPRVSLSTVVLGSIVGPAAGAELELRTLPPIQPPAPPLPNLAAVGIPPAAIGVQQQPGYIPTWAPDGRIGTPAGYSSVGGMTIGHSAIGDMGRPFHGPQHVEMRGLNPAGPVYPVIVDDPQ